MLQNISEPDEIESAILLAKLKTGDIDEIAELLASSHQKIRDEAEQALIKTGEAKSRLPLLEYAFRFPKRYYAKRYSSHSYDIEYYEFADSNRYLYDVAVYRSIFFEYTELILSVAGYKCYIANYKFHYPLDESIASLEKLCTIKSEISNYILHLVANRNDIPVYDRADEYGRLYPGTVNLSKLRMIAMEELHNRGDPKYDKSVFEQKESWISGEGKAKEGQSVHKAPESSSSPPVKVNPVLVWSNGKWIETQESEEDRNKSTILKSTILKPTPNDSPEKRKQVFDICLMVLKDYAREAIISTIEEYSKIPVDESMFLFSLILDETQDDVKEQSKEHIRRSLKAMWLIEGDFPWEKLDAAMELVERWVRENDPATHPHLTVVMIRERAKELGVNTVLRESDTELGQ